MSWSANPWSSSGSGRRRRHRTAAPGCSPTSPRSGSPRCPRTSGHPRSTATSSPWSPGTWPGRQTAGSGTSTELTAGFERGDTTEATDTAARIGALAARLHRALARPSTIVPEPCRRATTAAEHRRGTRLLDEALRVTPGAAGERLAARVARLGDDIETLDTAEAIGTQPIHGDLHVGQLLRDGAAGSRSPTSTAIPFRRCGELGSDGVERRSAMVDLASLVQSVDHVARVVARWRPDLGDQVPTFVAAATTRVVEAYAEVAPIEPQLLKPLRAIQELHELVYAAQVLPRWRYAPDAALATLYP